MKKAPAQPQTQNDATFIELSEDDNEAIHEAYQEVTAARASLGKLREAYLQRESEFIAQIRDRSRCLEYAVRSAASKYVCDYAGAWDYDPNLGGFTKDPLD